MSTIYITEAGTLLKIQDNHVKVFHQQQLSISLPIPHVSQIILFGQNHLSSKTIKLLLYHHISVLFLSQHGEYLGRLENDSPHQPKYLAKQVKRSQDTEFIINTAQSCMGAQLHNQLLLLQHFTHHVCLSRIQTAQNFLALLIEDLPMANSLEELREYETSAASFYYPALSSFLPQKFKFKQRYSRTPSDVVNILLNLGYTLLHQHIHTLLKSSGLHPNWASLHQEAYHHSPLACDLMAEFRAPLVDDLVVNLLKKRTMTLDNYTLPGKQRNTQFDCNLLKIFLHHWEEKLKTLVVHPLVGEVSYRQCLEWQVQEYIACLLGDIDFYRPLLVKLKLAQSNFTNTGVREKRLLEMVKR
ncbi:hypothetical protein NUACC21_49040 [Scytonema sp. NUACC21]